MHKTIIAVLVVFAMLYGCLGQGQVSNEEVDKVLNGTDRKNVSVGILMYYGEGCPHCANTISLLNELNQSYNISMTLKETWHNDANQNEMLAAYGKFGANTSLAGVPTMIIGGKMMVIGELSVKNWIKTIDMCGSGRCPSGAFDDDTVPALG
jgi:glutaredoxin